MLNLVILTSGISNKNVMIVGYIVLLNLGLLIGLSLVAPLDTAKAIPNPNQAFITAGNGTVNWLWQNPVLPSINLNGISCGSQNSCMAAGDDGLVVQTSDGGNTWNISHEADNIGNLEGISCPSPAVCYAVGDQGRILKFLSISGSGWSTQLGPSQLSPYLKGVSCTDIYVCYAVGSQGGILLTTDGGANWHYPVNAILKDGNYLVNDTLNAVTCVLANQTPLCFAVGDNGYIFSSSNPGVLWNKEDFSNHTKLNGISCGNAHCIAVGNNGTIETNNIIGGSWTTVVSPTAQHLTGVSCAATTWVCFATGGSGILKSLDSGQTWAMSWSPAIGTVSGGYNLNSISCKTTTKCVAAGEAGLTLATANSGVNWGAAPTIYPDSFSAIDCPSALICWIVGTHTVYRTIDGGNNWQLLANFSLDASGISCLSVTQCMVVSISGFIKMVWLDGQNNFKQEDISPFGSNPHWNGVSCHTISTCVVVGEAGAIWRYMGKILNNPLWQIHNSNTPFALYGIDCPTPIVCFTVGDVGRVRKNNDITNIFSWSDAAGTYNPGYVRWYDPAISQDVAGNLRGIKCPTATRCYVAAQNGYFAKYNNPYPQYPGYEQWTTWVLNSHSSLSGVDCLSVSNCTMVGSGTILELTDDGNTQVEGKIGRSTGMRSISCVVNCIAAGYKGSIVASAQLVWVPSDNGGTGTLSNALNQAGQNQAIKFKLPVGNTQLNSGKVYPVVPNGVRLLGKCGNSGPLIHIDDNKNPGLVLGGNNILDGIYFNNFSGPGIKIGVNKGGNKFQCTRIGV